MAWVPSVRGSLSSHVKTLVCSFEFFFYKITSIDLTSLGYHWFAIHYNHKIEIYSAFINPI